MKIALGETVSREIVSGAAIALILKAVAFLSTFGLSLVVARVLEVRDAGLVFLGIAIVTVLSSLSRFGLDKPIVRLVASLREAGDSRSISAAVTYAIVLVGFAGLLCAGFVGAGSEWISRTVFSQPGLASVLVQMCVAIPCIAIAATISHGYQGQKALVRYLLLFSIAVPLFALGLIAFSGPGKNASDVSRLYMIAALVTAVIGALFWRANPGFALSPIRAITPALSATRSTFIVILSQMVNTWAAVLLLGSLADSDAVAIYHVANRTAILISFVLIAINSIAAPKFASLYHSRDSVALEKTACFSTRLMTVAALPMLFLFLLTPDWVLSWFGDDFTGGANVLRVLAVGQFISVSCGSVANLLLMTGHEKDFRNVSVSATILNLSLSFLAIAYWGAIGAAVATMVALAFLNIASAVIVRRRLGFWSIGFLPSSRRR